MLTINAVYLCEACKDPFVLTPWCLETRRHSTPPLHMLL